MKELKKEDIKKEVFDLYDAYAHSKIPRREFIEKLSIYAIGGITITSLMSFFIPKYPVLSTIDGQSDAGHDTLESGNLITPNPTSSNWFMYHGGYSHGGYINSGSNLNSKTVNPKDFGLLRSLDLQGSILSVPAIVDGYIYAGVANSHHSDVYGSNGGTLYKIEITTGTIVAHYSWQLGANEGDSHGFYGMGCTPSIINGKVYFTAFNGHVYCLNQKDLSHNWNTDLRNTDPSKNQPVSNTSESIIRNIFDTPGLLNVYLDYVAGLASQDVGQVITYFKTANPPTVDKLKPLAKDLKNAIAKDDSDKVREHITHKMTEVITNGIKLDPPGFKDFLIKKALPSLGLPVAAGWCSPVVVNFESNGQQKSRLYVGVSEGENPLLFGMIYALDAETGKVDWIYCTNKNESSSNNPPNQLPSAAIGGPISNYQYTTVDGFPESMGCSVWSAITYDEGTGNLYCSTGNPQPDGGLPTKGYSNGVLALKAATGDFVAFTQMPKETAYRDSDDDVDIASACTVFDLKGRKVVGVSCKNGGFMTCHAKTLELIKWTNLLPKTNNNSDPIAAIDIHPPPSLTNVLSPYVSNEISNQFQGENYYGPFNTAAIHPPSETLFIGLGGPNYHLSGPGIDFNTTPFMRAINMTTLKDAWPMNTNDPPKYTKTGNSMYKTAGESGLSSPAVVNDVVFCSTSKIAIYAFNVADGSLLWSRNIGSQTEGFNGGYGYCLGPAIWKDYVVAGGLILGQSGGILEIYGPLPSNS